MLNLSIHTRSQSHPVGSPFICLTNASQTSIQASSSFFLLERDIQKTMRSNKHLPAQACEELSQLVRRKPAAFPWKSGVSLADLFRRWEEFNSCGCRRKHPSLGWPAPLPASGTRRLQWQCELSHLLISVQEHLYPGRACGIRSGPPDGPPSLMPPVCQNITILEHEVCHVPCPGATRTWPSGSGDPETIFEFHHIWRPDLCGGPHSGFGAMLLVLKSSLYILDTSPSSDPCISIQCSQPMACLSFLVESPISIHF